MNAFLGVELVLKKKKIPVNDELQTPLRRALFVKSDSQITPLCVAIISSSLNNIPLSHTKSHKISGLTHA
jgi:hypothetical protein